jgi:hypothetical protein
MTMLCSTLIWAQAVSTSQISGTVQDAGGGAVTGATVTVTQTDTGFMRNATTGSDGSYLLPTLPIGPYRMEVTKEGFSTFVEPGIVLEVNTNPTINPVLKVGAVSEQVTVEAEALAVESHSSGIGQVIDQLSISELPLNARQPINMIFLGGVSVPQSDGNLVSNRSYPTVSLSVAGGQTNGISYVMDGASHNDPYNNLNLPLPFPDALQEFKVETSSVGAQYGQHASAAVNPLTKSGSNGFHGDLFEYARNYLFNARNFFATSRDSLKQNQFGGTIGGPIRKNKLFFFVGFQETIKRSNPGGSFNFVPTTAMLGGDFTVEASRTCQAKALTLAAPFANNVLPASLINPIAVKLINFLPKSSDPCGRVNYAIGSNLREIQTIGRVDYQMTSKQSMFLRYLLSNNVQPIISDPANIFTFNATAQDNWAHSVVLGDNYVISPNTFSSTRLTMNLSRNDRYVLPFFSAADLGINVTSPVSHYVGLSVSGGISIGGGATNPGYFHTQTYGVSEDLTLVRGHHQLSAGFEYLRAIMYTQNNRPSNGQLTFNGQATSVSGVAGLGYADLLEGALDSFSQGNVDFDDNASQYYAFYAQDSWKINRHLSMNFGVRFEPYLPQRNLDNQVDSFSLPNLANNVLSTTMKTAPAGLIFTGDSGLPGGQTYGYKAFHLLPRAGLVWDPDGKGKTSVRISYGLLYDTPHLFFYDHMNNNPPWGATVSLSGGPFNLQNPWATYPGGNPFAAAGGRIGFFPLGGVFTVAPADLKANQVQTWNVAAQRQIGTWLVSATYVGNETAHLWTGQELDTSPYIPGTCAAGQYGLTAPGPCSTLANEGARKALTILNPKQGIYYSSVANVNDGSTSSYNAMLLSGQHRLGNNFSVLANWTWSHCVATPSSTEITGASYEQPYNLAADRSNCAQDLRHVLNVSGILTTPRFSGKWLRLFASGWQAAPIIRFTTSALVTVTTGVDNALTGVANQRANQLLPNVYSSPATLTSYLNPLAFGPPATGTYGPTRPLTIAGPSTLTIDMAVTRIFRIRESKQLQFRAEAFNVPNSFEPGLPVTAENSSTFGQITSQANSGRIMQFAIKYVF